MCNQMLWGLRAEIPTHLTMSAGYIGSLQILDTPCLCSVLLLCVSALKGFACDVEIKVSENKYHKRTQ